MTVDPGFEQEPTPRAMRLLQDLRGHFTADRKGSLITYQEVLRYIREVWGWEFPAHWHNHPMVTLMLSRLWRAGLIEKYRRGLWGYTPHAKRRNPKRIGKNYGIAYYIWRDSGQE